MFELALGVVIGVVAIKKIKWLEKRVQVPPFTRVVQFESGKYALRRGYCGVYEYKDQIRCYWWTRGSKCFESCLTDDPGDIDNLCDKGTPVDLDD